MTPLSLDHDVEAALDADSPVAIGVSGGKDSCLLALRLAEHLHAHRGPVALIHADLGRVEWAESLGVCERLAAATGYPLIVVKRQAGDLMDRWLARWESSRRRYAELETVRLVLPWSTASMRFCTSELKTAVICADLVKRFPGKTILSAVGIRRAESPGRKRAPVSAPQAKLSSARWRTSGRNWNPILDVPTPEVYADLGRRSFPLHPAYSQWGSSRVSCAFCILGSQADLAASAAAPGNKAIYRQMVELEAASSFAFRDGGWLADVAPHLLSNELRGAVEAAKGKAARRAEIEAGIPAGLLFTSGTTWPERLPTDAEAEALAGVRAEIGELLGIPVRYTTGADVAARYAELRAAQ